MQAQWGTKAHIDQELGLLNLPLRSSMSIPISNVMANNEADMWLYSDHLPKMQ